MLYTLLDKFLYKFLIQVWKLGGVGKNVCSGSILVCAFPLVFHTPLVWAAFVVIPLFMLVNARRIFGFFYTQIATNGNENLRRSAPLMIFMVGFVPTGLLLDLFHPSFEIPALLLLAVGAAGVWFLTGNAKFLSVGQLANCTVVLMVNSKYGIVVSVAVWCILAVYLVLNRRKFQDYLCGKHNVYRD